MPDIAGLILMGGQNKRMNGQHKAFLTLNGTSFLDLITNELKGLKHIYLSVDDKDKFQNLDYPLIEDAHSAIGPLGGIYSGLLSCEADYLFITACDMPFITEAFVAYMVSHVTPGTDCVVVFDKSHRFYPLGAIYSKNIIPEIEKMIEAKNYRLKDLIHNVHSKMIPISHLPFDEKVLSNINTPEDYATFIQQG